MEPNIQNEQTKLKVQQIMTKTKPVCVRFGLLPERTAFLQVS